ncbi:hypothetical protein ACFL5Y_01680 [Candidatus Omnitrophota bacterium]
MDEGKRKFVKRELTVFMIFVLFGVAPFIAFIFSNFGLSLTWNLRVSMISLLVIVLYPIYIVLDVIVWIIRKMIRAIRKK